MEETNPQQVNAQQLQEELGHIVLFDISPEKFPWRVPRPRQIEDRRARMSDVLLFDTVLAGGGIQHPDALYPPRDVDALKRLLDAIEATSYDSLKKDCLVYYLLKSHEDGKDGRADRFQLARCIPPQFVHLADAYWYLDSGRDVARAVSLLSDARLDRNYPSKIIEALSLEENANELILRYIRTAKPSLTEPNDIDAYSIALAESSLMDAWQYQRSFPEDSATRGRVLRNILRWSLTLASTAKPRAKALAQLLSFPFSPFEQSLLHKYALDPPPEIPIPSIPVIQDLACVRLIQGGRLSEAVKLDRRIAITPIRGTFSGKLSDQARKVASDRKQIMDEIMAVMPEVERMLLQAELDQMPEGGDTISTVSKVVEVRSPKATGKESHITRRSPRKTILSDAPIPPIPQRSGAPRFGGPISTNAAASVATVRSMFDSISAGRRAAEPQQQPKPLTSEDTDPLIDSQDAPSVGMLPGKSNETVQSTSAKGAKSPTPRKGPTSLFDTRGSANKVANAFFIPPPSQGPSVGTKRPRPEEPSPKRPPLHSAEVSDGSALDVPESLQALAYDDVEMRESDAAVSHTGSSRRGQSSSSRKANDGYDDPVFSRPSLESQRISSASRKAPSATPAPPGAFDVDADEPAEPVEREEQTSARTQQSGSSSASTSRPPSRKQPTRLTRTQSSKEDLSRSVPGAFIDEEDDYVAPLPSAGPSTGRQSRKSSRASKTTEEVKPKATPRATRRSSRLSERGSSPEPVSPEAPRTRRATATRTPAKGKARKQR